MIVIMIEKIKVRTYNYYNLNHKLMFVVYIIIILLDICFFHKNVHCVYTEEKKIIIIHKVLTIINVKYEKS